MKLRCTLEEDRTQIVNFGPTENIVSAKIEMCDKLSFPVYIQFLVFNRKKTKDVSSNQRDYL